MFSKIVNYLIHVSYLRTFPWNSCYVFLLRQVFNFSAKICLPFYAGFLLILNTNRQILIYKHYLFLSKISFLTLIFIISHCKIFYRLYIFLSRVKSSISFACYNARRASRLALEKKKKKENKKRKSKKKKNRRKKKKKDYVRENKSIWPGSSFQVLHN